MPMQQLTIIMEEKNNDLTEIIAQALNEMKSDLGDKFDLKKVNLAELEMILCTLCRIILARYSGSRT